MPTDIDTPKNSRTSSGVDNAFGFYGFDDGR